jgi:hypothetical protein
MKDADIPGYNSKFHELARLVPYMVNPEPKRIQRYIWGLVPQIRGLVTASKPTSMHDDMDLAGSLADEMVRNGTLGKAQAGDKRKWDNNKQGSSGSNDYRKPSNAVKNFVATVPERALYARTQPKCNKCNYHHELHGRHRW